MTQLSFDELLAARDDPVYNQASFFGGSAPLSESIGYLVVLGFGLFFSLFTTLVVMADKYFGSKKEMTSEHFNTAGRTVKTGLTASVIVSQWTWAATLLQSSNVAWSYGVSGPFWYASGATIQVLLFGVLAISLKKVAPNAHTFCEIVKARWGTVAHITFIFFAFCANIIVTSMLLLGGAATVEALTGMDYQIASFLIPWGVILYTVAGGLRATFIASYIHTTIIFGVLITMILIVYIKEYSSDEIYDLLDTNVNLSEDQCKIWYSTENSIETTHYPDDTYSCGQVSGNEEGSYLTMLSADGLMFGIINVVGNFGTVFVDQSYWQSAIAAKPESAAKGYMLGGICWFSIPFSLATSLGLASTALMLPITADEAGSGLVPPAVATFLLGDAGSVLILVMLFMAIVSTGSAESIAVSSLVSYDIYREYMNPDATGEDILRVSRIVIVLFGLFMGCFSLILYELELNLGWVYLFMGVCIGSAVCPLAFMVTWSKASGTGAVLAAWGGLIAGVVSWLSAASIQSGEVTIDTLGTNEVMLTGNLFAILTSGLIHIVYSLLTVSEPYDWSILNDKIKLVENDVTGLSEAERDIDMLDKTYKWITSRGYLLSFVLVIFWPCLSIPAGVFTKDYFAFWVLVAIVWGFGATVVITILPLIESQDDIFAVVSGILSICKKSEEVVVKEVEEPAEEPEA